MNLLTFNLITMITCTKINTNFNKYCECAWTITNHSGGSWQTCTVRIMD